VIIELTIECEIADDRILRLGVKPTSQAPWVVLMILEAVIHQLKLVIEADYARRMVPSKPINLGDLRSH